PPPVVPPPRRALLARSTVGPDAKAPSPARSARMRGLLGAETRGFEPPRRFTSTYSLSRGAHSAALPRLLMPAPGARNTDTAYGEHPPSAKAGPARSPHNAPRVTAGIWAPLTGRASPGAGRCA